MQTFAKKHVHSEQTIAALSTPLGGGIALIRVSGPQSWTGVEQFFRPIGKKHSPWSHRLALVGNWMDGEEVLDQVVLLPFKGPNSFTGEDSVEISFHASPYVVERALHQMAGIGIRPAQAGEFTRRAFMNGKMDLAQAEAVADLLSASHKAAARMAMQHLGGAFSNRIAQMRLGLLDFCALLELELDFSEEDVEFASRSDLAERIQQIEQQIQALLHTYSMGRALKQGIPVAIVGRPNAGKSTLLNALLQEERALVSDIPGTTRDTVEDELILEGIRFRFIDTAGIRDTQDPIEKLGIERSFDALRRSGMVLHLGDAQSQSLEEFELEEADWRERLGLEDKPIFRIWNKMDVPGAQKPAAGGIAISARNGDGLEELKQALLDNLAELGYGNQDLLISQARHKGLLEQAAQALERVRQHLEAGYSGDLLALDLRQAMRPLEELTGQIGTEEVLGHIFGRFCIGK